MLNSVTSPEKEGPGQLAPLESISPPEEGGDREGPPKKNYNLAGASSTLSSLKEEQVLIKEGMALREQDKTTEEIEKFIEKITQYLKKQYPLTADGKRKVLKGMERFKKEKLKAQLRNAITLRRDKVALRKVRSMVNKTRK